MNQFETRKQTIIKSLVNLYPEARIALIYKTPWELLVAVILSAQCSDIMVNKVTPGLFKKYPTIRSFAGANMGELEGAVRPTGFFRNKAKNIKSSAQIILNKYREQVPGKMDDLIKLPGVARKTANIVLSNAFYKFEGIAVDTHVSRISQRLRLVDINLIGGTKKIEFNKNDVKILDYIKNADTNKIENQLMKLVTRTMRYQFTYAVIDHGRAVCKAQRPRCSICKLADKCFSSRL